MALAIKDPDARIDYQIDWGADYLEEQFITASQWTIAPAEAGGLALVSDSYSLTRAAVQVEGGMPGAVYQLTNRVTLNDGQIDERSIAVRVDAR